MTMRHRTTRRPAEAGSIFTVLLGAVALTATVGVLAFQTLSGPVMTAVRVKNKTLAETEMLAAAKITLVDAVNQAGSGDCDADTFIEPVVWRAGSGPTNAGLIPLTIGAPTTDPWGTSYGYCVWDIGPTFDDAACGGPGALRLNGSDTPLAGHADTQTVMAIVSAGPDRQFQTSCINYVDATTSVVTKGGDDLVMKYTYAEAGSISDGLWGLKLGDPDTAKTAKDVEIGDYVQIDNASGQLWAGGGVELGNETLVTICDGTNVGLMRYNTAASAVEVCDGTAWVALEVGGGGTTNGLVGYWKLDDGAGAAAADSSGNGLDGTVSGATWTASGLIDGAITFDGTNDYIEVADDALLDVTNVTVSAWVYKTVANQAGWGAIASRQAGVAGDNTFWLGFDNSASDLYACFINTANGFQGATGSASTGDATTWVHVSCTYDGSNIRIYRNGTQIATAAHTGDMTAETNRMLIGADNEAAILSPSDYLNATVDDVRLYDRALTASEVSSLAGGVWIDNGTSVYLANPTRKVGIGTDAPDSLLHVYDDGNNTFYEALKVEGEGEPAVSLYAASATSWLNPLILTARSRGTPTAPTIVGSSDSLFELVVQGDDGTAFRDAAYIKVRVDGTPGVNDMPGQIQFHTQADGNGGALEGTTPEMVIKNDGKIGIGTESPSALLHVKKSTTDAYAETLIVEGEGEPAMGLRAASATATLNPILYSTRSRGTIAAPTIVSSGDSLLELEAEGYDGTAFRDAAYIKVLVDGTPGASDMPGRIEFHTQADGNGGALEGTTPEMVIKNSGNIGIGIGDPAELLSLSGNDEKGIRVDVASSASANRNPFIRMNRSRGTAAAPTIVSNGDDLGELMFYGYDGSAFRNAALIEVRSDGTPGANDMPARMEFHVQADGAGSFLGDDASTAAMVIKSGGNVGIGTDAPDHKLTVSGDFADDGILIHNIRATDSDSGNLDFWRARGTSATPAIVQSGDELAHIAFKGYDGADYILSADIIVSVDGTPGAGGDMPGRMSFRTKPDNSGGMLTRMTIKNSGNVGIGTSNPQSTLHVPDGSYAQFENNNAGAPAAGDCDADTERGRMSIDTTNNRLYICNGATRGWDYVALTN